MRIALFLFSIFIFYHPSSLLADSKPKVAFGALAELTGPGAMNGAACQSGYKIAVDLFKTAHPELLSKVDVVYGDHKRDQKTAISEFQRLGLGNTWGVACNHSIVGVVLNPLSKTAKVPLFGVMGHASFISDNPYAFRIIPTPDEEGGGLAKAAYARGARKAAILLLQDDYLLAIGDAFEKHFKALGGEIVYKDSLEESLSDFSTIATRIRAAKPDIIELTLGFQQFGPAIKRLREQGVKQPIYSNYWLSYPQVIEAARPENVEGSVYITEKSDYPVFVDAYSRLNPSSFRSGVVFRCYTALSTALSAYASHPEVKTKTEYYQTLLNATSLNLPDRKIQLINREVQFQPELYEIKSGKSRLLGG